MPRIPVRTQPYSSPSRQHRHFKNKRDQILRALGKASYINGSHFAILWVNSRGESETYASEVFQSKLANWFHAQVLDEARRLVLVASDAAAEAKQGQQCLNEGGGGQDLDDQENNAPSPSPDMLEDDDTIGWAEDDIRPDSRHSNHSSRLHTPFMQPGLADIVEHQPLQHPSYQQSIPRQMNGVPELRRSISSPNPLSIVNTNVHSNYFPHQQPPPPRNNPNYNRPRPLNLSRSNSRASLGPEATIISPAGGTEYKPLTIGNGPEVTIFLETRFRQLQQLCCKIVSKAWIKVIEPKKQTRFPYNRGEESKPEWWPDDVRHKEPDHLMKPERITLLMTLLRCGRIPVERLQLATAEVAAFIPPEKMHLLREIYRVGREEEKYRLGEIPGSTTIMVASSAEISPASDEGAPSPLYPEPVRAMSHSSSTGVSQLGIPQMQRPPSRPRSAQPSFPMDELQNNPFNPNGNPPAKRQKTSSPQGPQGQHVMHYPDMYQQQQYYNFQLAGQHHPHQHPHPQQQPHQLTHSQSQLLYPTHGGQNLRYQPEIKSAPPGQQQFFVFPPDFPSPPPNGGFHTQFPHDHHQQPPTSHAQHQQPQPQQPNHPAPFGAAAYAAAQQLSSLRETNSLQPPSSSGSQLPEPQPTPQHASTSAHFLNTRSSPYLPTPLRAAGVPGTGVSAGPNVSFSEFLNSPMTAGPGPASDGAVGRIRRGEKRRASDDESGEESSDDEDTIDGNPSPSKKA